MMQIVFGLLVMLGVWGLFGAGYSAWHGAWGASALNLFCAAITFYCARLAWEEF